MIRQSVRALVDRVAPGLARAYREHRERRRASDPLLPTPFGFALAGNATMATGTFEPEEIRIFLEALDRADACVDVGANIGFYACLAASRSRPVVAIEPLPTNLHLLCRNVLENRFNRLVEVLPVGVGRDVDLLPLYGVATGASFVTHWAGTSTSLAHIVPVTTLDALLRGRFPDRPLLIKMDVEGFELAALQGARETLTRRPQPTWIVEIQLTENVPGGFNERFLETFELFWSHGYDARTCDARADLVTPEDVRRWHVQRRSDRSAHNYLFRAPNT